MSTLVIVESPTKARTIRNYLPNGYRVEASMGHVRDLPSSADEIPAAHKGKDWAQLGVNVRDHFEPLYVIPKSKKQVVKELKEALKAADELILATDEDREGESISWHLKEILKPKVPMKRMVFHEITPEAIARALENCRNINENLVHAQETRRILDRLVGYTLSPLLWKKIARGLSAGRVQSVALRLICEREEAIEAFVPEENWTIDARLHRDDLHPFKASLKQWDGEAFRPGKQSDAEAVVEQLRDAEFSIAGVKRTTRNQQPSPPYIT
ncbi:MAG: DNA topoisomerase, partial [Spirulinaceae cyanobacterium]